MASRMTEWRNANQERSRKWAREYMRKRRGSDVSGDALSVGDVMAKARDANKPRATNCGKRTCPAASKFYFHLRYLDRKDEYVTRAKAKPIEKQREYRKAWKAKNGARVLLHGRFRKRNMKQATPPWLTPGHWYLMNLFYEQARQLTADTGIEHNVDHVVPLRGKTVSGLHVPWNMRVMVAAANQQRPRHWDAEGDSACSDTTTS